MSNIQYWTMKDGKKISVDDMDIDHLKNVLKMILRNNQRVQKTCPHNATQALEMGNIERCFMEEEVDEYECDATEIDIY